MEAADSASRQETFLQGEHVKAQGMLQDMEKIQAELNAKVLELQMTHYFVLIGIVGCSNTVTVVVPVVLGALLELWVVVAGEPLYSKPQNFL